jgi:transposase
MEMYEYIRFSHFKLKHSIRKIHRTTGLDRKTIRKAISSVVPAYKTRKPREKVVIGPYMAIIRTWLIADKRVHKKQRHTSTRIHNRLKEEHGYSGSLSTTTAAIRELRLELDVSKKEVFIPSDPEKREGAEMDWGELYIDLKGKRTRVYLFSFRSKYSGKVFARLYPVMTQACFFDGHIRAFAYFEGVFSTIIYDNLKTAVKQVLKGRERVEQDAFTVFRNHYNYEAQFCSICKGSEKGGVEGSVGYVRRNFLTPIPKVDSLEDLNNYLLDKCLHHDLRITSGHKEPIGKLFAVEKPKLLGLPKSVYTNFTLHPAVVDKYLTVKLKRNRYSVPRGYRGKQVVIELGLDEVRVVYKNQIIARHKREHARDRWVVNPWHYLEALQRKPGAFHSSRILSEIEQSWDPVVKKTYDLQVKKYGQIEGVKEFISTLLYFKDRSYEDMIAVLELSLEQKTVSKESVELMAETTNENIINIEEAGLSHIPAIANFSIPEADVNRFDALMEVSNG